MKKYLKIITITSSIVLSGCSLIPDFEPDHTFSNSWTTDINGHWHQCTDPNCDSKKDLGYHQWNDGQVILEPTRESTGTLQYTCTVCGFTKTETIPAESHEAVASWSSDENYHWKKCTFDGCDEKYFVEEHQWDGGTVITEATHLSKGLKKYVCSKCGATKNEEIEKISHSFSEYTPNTELSHIKSCSCGYQETEPHSWDNGVILSGESHSSTCTKEFTCNKCGASRIEVLNSISHTFDREIIKDEYLKEPGVYYKSCSCGKRSDNETFSVYIGKSGSEFSIIEQTHNPSYGLSTEKVGGRSNVYKYAGSGCDYHDVLGLAYFQHAKTQQGMKETIEKVKDDGINYVTFDIFMVSGATLRVSNINESNAGQGRVDVSNSGVLTYTGLESEHIAFYDHSGNKLTKAIYGDWMTIVIDIHYWSRNARQYMYNTIASSNGTIYFDNVRYFKNQEYLTCFNITESVEYEDMETTPSYNEYIDFSDYKTFYFDSENGNDSNDGLSMDSPKKNTSEILSIISTYGNSTPLRILLRKNCVFEGNIVLGGYSSTEEKPFILSSYGNDVGHPVVKGILNGSLENNAIITIQEANTRVDGIEVTGKDCTRGIFVKSKTRGIFKNIVIKNCYVHDINWNWTYQSSPNDVNPSSIDVESVTPYTPNNGSTNRYRRLYGGIEIFNGSPSGIESNSIGPSTYDHLFVENNRVENVSHVAINFYNYWTNRAGINYGFNKYVPSDENYADYNSGIGFFPFTNIVVRNNYTNCIGGDAIIVDGSTNFFIENNTAYKSSYLGRTGCFNGGIWCHNSKNGYMRFNEAAYTYLQNGAGDGEGFDIDIACENVKVYYNYCHHNEGGGLLLCNNSSNIATYDKTGSLIDSGSSPSFGIWKNNYAKNNIFAYNGLESNNHRSAFITVARPCNDFIAENNTVIVGDISSQHIINIEGTDKSTGHVYRHNLFYCASATAKPKISSGGLLSPLYDSNLYFNVIGGNSAYGEFVLSNDQNAIVKDTMPMNMPTLFDGFNQAKLFYPSISVKGINNKLDKQLRIDFNGKSTLSESYLGAILR